MTFPWIYLGERRPGGCAVAVAVPRPGGRTDLETLDPCFSVHNHSPDGFEWGFAGSGPAQLSLAVLCDFLRRKWGASLRHTADQEAYHLHQRFKAVLISCLPEAWEFGADVVESFRHVEAVERTAGQAVNWKAWRARLGEHGQLRSLRGTLSI